MIDRGSERCDASTVRVPCQHCGEVEERAGLDAVEGGFGFSCAACDQITVLAPVAAPEPAAPEAPVAAAQTLPSTPSPVPLKAGEHECPKCGHVQRDHHACHKCGLLFALARPGQSFDDPLDGHAHAKLLRERWGVIAEDFDAEDKHHSCIQMCAELDALEYAGQCYRKAGARFAEHPQLGKYRERVVGAALAQVGRTPDRMSEVESRLRRLMILGFFAVMLLALAVGFYLVSRRSTMMQTGY